MATRVKAKDRPRSVRVRANAIARANAGKDSKNINKPAAKREVSPTKARVRKASSPDTTKTGKQTRSTVGHGQNLSDKTTGQRAAKTRAKIKAKSRAATKGVKAKAAGQAAKSAAAKTAAKTALKRAGGVGLAVTAAEAAIKGVNKLDKWSAKRSKGPAQTRKKVQARQRGKK